MRPRGAARELYQSVMDAHHCTGEHRDQRWRRHPRRRSYFPRTSSNRRESRDIPKAVSTISKHTDNMNDPIAHKMEIILGTFMRQLCLDESRTMKESVLTDFFDRT